MDESIIWFFPEGKEEHEVQRASHEPASGRAVIKSALHDTGLSVVEITDMESLRERLAQREAALLLAELPDGGSWEGWDRIANARENGNDLPVLVISGLQGGEAAEAAFRAGANDYMAHPLHPGELRCRVENLLALTKRRRAGGTLKLGGLRLEPSRRRAVRDGRDLKLTAKEFALLYYLVANSGEICSREDILRHVWGYHFHAGTNVTDVYIRHLRLKVDKGHRQKLIHTVRGAGYVVKAPDMAP
ncbi:two-component system copper resistance phosphate regulon response regulator CusR [Paenibacillus forsythiae]|uniref:Two-component system copper resistance phosphate regulon response regulator CusR n=1 Tax=Paenibacillus forsythiae TaxID=365616 RepID=A0ABU3H1W5_9BACL|nr:response regulator transcription factor [Paenibacillus forsythiae]MDT3424686.1 two-component system copper resistance phosphate regulon response regulator CusR [Paenibacillus forsythiae]